MNKILTLFVAVATALCTMAQVSLEYEAGVTINAGDGNFAPYYIASGRGGTVTQQYSSLVNAAISHRMDTTCRLSWGVGVELWGGYASSTDYMQFNDGNGWSTHKLHPARAWVQQAYVVGKYRSLFAVIGQKQQASRIVNPLLGSGDMVMSGNARPQPGIKAGFIDFQNIPLTNGWVQIAGEVGYYRMTDKNWLEDHYNRYNSFLTTGYWMNYKNIYFRTNPDKPLSVTVGMQAACQFGGKNERRENGVVTATVDQKADFEAFFKSLIPSSGGNNTGDKYYEGNHLGTWDLAAEYRLPSGKTLRAYYQSPWEDGSGIGKLNGFDGVWGIEYKANHRGVVSGAVVEYIDLTNQSGPIHWAPGDFENTPLTDEATGADDYYNNYAFNGYQALGMSIGSPFVMSPLYNTDGYMRFTDNMIRGFHCGIMGDLSDCVSYRLLASYRKSWGTPQFPRVKPADDTSMMVEAQYAPKSIPGLGFKAQFAFDHGSLYGNNTGALLCVSYHGNLTLRK